MMPDKLRLFASIQSFLLSFYAMNALLKEIKSSLLRLVGYSVESLPRTICTIIILLITRYVANVTRRMASVALKRMLKSQSLRSLLVQTSYVSTWVAGTLESRCHCFSKFALRRHYWFIRFRIGSFWLCF